jgi:phosphate starvation-inducible PhoH-like protein
MVGENVPDPSVVLSDGFPVGRGRMIRPKTHGQQKYMEAIRENTLTFGIGPAGTGKTYLAMAAAVDSLINGSVRRIILTRPAVEAGERLGFLPGDLTAKVDPYLRPLYDALWDMLGPEETASLIERGTIEIAPLAYMRGRTLNDACVILDEAQNTTPEQMKMFLTRLGFNSKMIITGDISQTDLPTGRRSGLRVVRDILQDIPGVAFMELTSRDVVRHRIVASIVEAYARFETQEK